MVWGAEQNPLMMGGEMVGEEAGLGLLGECKPHPE